MGTYSIKELERLSGIKAHTIRIWEKRFGLVEPSRTNSNIRFYSDDDLKKIINVSLLNNRGVKISKIASFSTEEINNQVLEISEVNGQASVFINQMLVIMIDLDEDGFEALLSRLGLKYGLERTITEFVYPFLDRIGILWQTGNISPAQEHFISNLIRQKIIVAIDALPVAPKNAKRALLFLPENELHEIGLLFCCYLMKKSGYRTFYLGQSVPYGDVKSISDVHHPDVFIMMMTTEREPKISQQLINDLASDFPKAIVLASGAAIKRVALTFPSNFHLFDKVLNLRDFLH